MVRKNGERLVVVSLGDGSLDHALTTYVMAQLRPSSGSVNSVTQAARGALDLHDFADSRGIDLGERIKSGALLHPDERVAFGNYLLASSSALPSSNARRLRSSLRYMDWKVEGQAAKLSVEPVAKRDYLKSVETVRSMMVAELPSTTDGGSQREGLSSAGRLELVAFLESEARLRARWPNPVVRFRNQLLVTCCLVLGHRMGEFLSLRLRDFDLDGREYVITRTHDSPHDPRVIQPLVKGHGRRLLMPAEQVAQMRDFIELRATLPFAGEHDFLFVTRNGRPLSRRMANRVFEQLRKEVPCLGDRFSPHTLRHTWNDVFSEVADRDGIPEHKEMQARMLVMGWRHPSSVAIYTRRTTRMVADRFSLGVQQRLFSRRDPK